MIVFWCPFTVRSLRIMVFPSSESIFPRCELDSLYRHVSKDA